MSEIYTAIENQKYLDINKWGEFLVKWSNGLEAYGTPISFVESTGFDQRKVTIKDIEYPIFLYAGTNYDKRKELMSQQKDYITKKDEAEYPLMLDIAHCFLCQNVVQGIDAQDNPDVKNNVVYDLGAYFITPNRYAATWGHSIWLPKNHDENHNRVKSLDNKLYPIVDGKTRGKLISADEIDDLTAACDKYHLVATRNHVLDSMSIPNHDHFHLQIEDMPSRKIFGDIIQKKYLRNITKGIYQSTLTPFDSLIITKDDCEDFSQRTSEIINNLEKTNHVFTLAYGKGTFIIAPRKNMTDNLRIAIGADLPLHRFDSMNLEYIYDVILHVPLRGEFSWDKYI